MNYSIVDMIINRKSIRSFTDERIPDSDLNSILEAGLNAPSAHNEQSWHFTVIRNKQMIHELSRDAKAAVIELGESDLMQMAKNGTFNVFYHPPVLIVVSGWADGRMSLTDCAAATENMVIAAESLSISSCWIAFVSYLFQKSDAGGWHNKLNLPDGYQPYYALSLGYCANEALKQSPKKNRRADTVNWIS